MKHTKEELEELSHEVREFDHAVATGALTMTVTPAWGKVVKLDIVACAMGDPNCNSSTTICFTDMDMVDKLIEDLQACRDEIKARQELIEN